MDDLNSGVHGREISWTLTFTVHKLVISEITVFTIHDPT